MKSKNNDQHVEELDLKNIAKKTVHIVMHAKGGVGKTMLSSKILERLILLGYDPLAIEVEPNNKGGKLSAYSALAVKSIQMYIEEGGSEVVSQKSFDKIYTSVLEQEQPVVIDIGAGAFKDFPQYSHDMLMVEDWQDHGYEVVLHLLVIPGVEIADTVETLQKIHQLLPTLNVFFWFNEFKAKTPDARDKAKSDGLHDTSFLYEFEEDGQTKRMHFLKTPVVTAVEELNLGFHFIPKPKHLFADAYKDALANSCLASEAIADPGKFGISTLDAKRILSWSADFFSGVDVLLNSLIDKKGRKNHE